MRAVTVIGAPTSAAAYAPGQEDGPAALREHGLLAALGGDVVDAGDVERFRWRPDRDRPRAANAAAAAERAGQVAARVAARPARTVRARARRRLHHRRRHGGRADRPRRRGPGSSTSTATPTSTSPASTIEGALDWMGVAHLLDVEGATPELAGLAGARPMLTAGRLAFLALAPVTPFETGRDRAAPAARGRARSGDRRPGGRRARGRSPRSTPTSSPSTSTSTCSTSATRRWPRTPIARRGCRSASAGRALATLCADPRVAALTVTEFNPHHGAADGADTRRLIEVLAAAL